MKVFIPTYKRYKELKSHLLFTDPRFEVKILVHTDEELEKYLGHSWLSRDMFVVTGVPTGKQGLIGQRNFYNNLVSDDEWYVSADDDIERVLAIKDELFQFESLPEEHCKKENFSEALTSGELYFILQHCIEKAEAIKSRLIGFAPVSNHFFRKTKWRMNAFCIGNFWMAKGNPDWEFPPVDSYGQKEDYIRTAQNLLDYGKTLRLDYLFADTVMFANGGLGLFSERGGDILDCIEGMMQDYPKMFRHNSNRKRPEYEVVMALRTNDQIRKWRLWMIIQGKLDKSKAFEILGEKKGKEFLDKYIKEA